jgi:hypothetical protein
VNAKDDNNDNLPNGRTNNYRDKKIEELFETLEIQDKCLKEKQKEIEDLKQKVDVCENNEVKCVVCLDVKTEVILNLF